MGKDASKFELTAHELRFCAAYIAEGNATAAAKAAGYKGNRIALGQRGYQLLKKRQIRDKIRELQHRAAETAQVSIDHIASQLARISFTKRTLIFDDSGKVIPPLQWPDALQSIVSHFEVEEITEFNPDTRHREVIGQRYKVKFVNPIEALKTLATWKQMIGRMSEPATSDIQQLVISGDANPDELIPLRSD